MGVNPDVLNSQLLQDLHAAGWDGSEVAYPGQTVKQTAMMYMSRSLLKKYHGGTTDNGRDSKALALFLECNESCRNFPGIQPNCLVDEIIIGELKSILYDFFNPKPGIIAVDGKRGFKIFRNREPLLLNLSDIAVHFGTGRGSNIGAPGADMYSKYVCSTMSATSPLLPTLFWQAISNDPLWQSVEFERCAIHGHELVSGDSLFFVPKSRDISRTCGKAPLMNMFFQKGIEGVLRARLKEVFNIDLSVQPERNALLAHIGSCNESLATIDLSSASDTISVSLLRDLLPREAFNWFMLTRSPITTLPSGEEIELHLMASMGNGFCFPLQTTLFASVVAAVYRVMGIKLLPFSDGPTPVHRNPTIKSVVEGCLTNGPVKQFQRTEYAGNFSAFGDDIIVDTRAYGTVCRILTLLGLKVNATKSFNEGFFRESCGHDYFHGENVRGVYIEKLQDTADVYSAINRLTRWSAYHGVFLPRCIGYLRQHCKLLLVPPTEDDAAGVHVPLKIVQRVKRNQHGGFKYMALVKVAPKFPIPPGDVATGYDPFRYLREIRCVDYPDPWRYSGSGLLLVFLAGAVRDCSIGIRTTGEAVYQLRRRSSPGWDGAVPRYVERRTFRHEWSIMAERYYG
jgi:hypothetical protein